MILMRNEKQSYNYYSKLILLPINGHVTDFVVLLYTFIFIFKNYFVVLPVMVNKDFHN